MYLLFLTLQLDTNVGGMHNMGGGISCFLLCYFELPHQILWTFEFRFTSLLFHCSGLYFSTCTTTNPQFLAFQTAVLCRENALHFIVMPSSALEPSWDCHPRPALPCIGIPTAAHSKLHSDWKTSPHFSSSASWSDHCRHHYNQFQCS